MSRAAPAILLAALVAGCAHSPPAEPGGYEIATVGDRTLVARGHGAADLEQRTPIEAGSLFRIASLTKQFTAVAVLALVEDGRFQLDAPLGSLLDDCPEAWRPITLRQLLSHTSGLSGDFGPLMAHRTEDLSPRQLIDLYRDRPLEAAPGAAWRYSNLNYWLLGLVIEKVAGQPYDAFVRARVLAPAGLQTTRYGRQEEIVADRVRGYARGSDGRWRNAVYFSQTLGYAAGGFLSSPAEMARWYRALGEGRIIRRDTLALALTPVTTTDGKSSGYGLGWNLAQIGGHAAAEHGGSSIGFVAYVVWIPDRSLFVGEFRNADGAEPQADAEALAARLLACKGAACR